MSKAQDEKGNTPIRHFLLERMAMKGFKISEVQVILVICRLTYGYKDTEAWRKYRIKRQLDRNRISYESLKRKTGLGDRAVENAMSELQKRNVVICYEKPIKRTGKAGVFGINSNDNEWDFNRTNVRLKEESLTARTCGKSGMNVRLNGNERAVKTPKRSHNQAEKQASITEHSITEHSIERKPSPSSVEKELSMGHKIWVAIGKKYYPMGGPPRVKLSTCLKFEEYTSDDPELARDCFNAVWLKLSAWESEAGRKCRKPKMWDLLDDATEYFDNGGPPEETGDDGVPDYVDRIYRGENDAQD